MEHGFDSMILDIAHHTQMYVILWFAEDAIFRWLLRRTRYFFSGYSRYQILQLSILFLYFCNEGRVYIR